MLTDMNCPGNLWNAIQGSHHTAMQLLLIPAGILTYVISTLPAGHVQPLNGCFIWAWNVCLQRCTSSSRSWCLGGGARASTWWLRACLALASAKHHPARVLGYRRWQTRWMHSCRLWATTATLHTVLCLFSSDLCSRPLKCTTDMQAICSFTSANILRTTAARSIKPIVTCARSKTQLQTSMQLAATVVRVPVRPRQLALLCRW